MKIATMNVQKKWTYYLLQFWLEIQKKKSYVLIYKWMQN
jgi:hypothetical protein